MFLVKTDGETRSLSIRIEPFLMKPIAYDAGLILQRID